MAATTAITDEMAIGVANTVATHLYTTLGGDALAVVGAVGKERVMAQVGARVSLLVALSPRVHLADLVRLQSVSPAAQQRGVGRHVRLGGGGTRWCARHGASLGALLGAEARPRAAVQRGKGGREGGRERRQRGEIRSGTTAGCERGVRDPEGFHRDQIRLA